MVTEERLGKGKRRKDSPGDPAIKVDSALPLTPLMNVVQDRAFTRWWGKGKGLAFVKHPSICVPLDPPGSPVG